MKEILKELKNINKNLENIQKFRIAELQLIKSNCVESSKQGRDIQRIKLMMEEKRQTQEVVLNLWNKFKSRFKK